MLWFTLSWTQILTGDKKYVSINTYGCAKLLVFWLSLYVFQDGKFNFPSLLFGVFAQNLLKCLVGFITRDEKLRKILFLSISGKIKASLVVRKMTMVSFHFNNSQKPKYHWCNNFVIIKREIHFLPVPIFRLGEGLWRGGGGYS